MELKDLKLLKRTVIEFANSLEPDEAAHNELLHIGLLCLFSNLWILRMKYFSKVGRRKFCRLLFWRALIVIKRTVHVQIKVKVHG